MIPGGTVLRRVSAVALCCLALAACQYIMQWTDKTGQDRGQRAAQADLHACVAQIGVDNLQRADFPDDVTFRKAQLAVWGKTITCMAGRGWEPDGHRYWTDTSGQARDEWNAQIDAVNCGEQTGAGSPAFQQMARDAQDAVWNKYLACMAGHGWKRADNDD